MTSWNESAWFAIFVGVALKSTAVLGAAWLAAFLLRGRSAAARHLVWTASAAAVLALPFFSVSLPEWRVPASGLMPGVSVLFQTTSNATADAGASLASEAARANAPRLPTPRGPDWRMFLMML